MSVVGAILCSHSPNSSRFITSCFTLHTLIPPDNISLLLANASPRSRDSKMYHFVCFVLLVSLEGIKTSTQTTSIEHTVSQMDTATMTYKGPSDHKGMLAQTMGSKPSSKPPSKPPSEPPSELTSEPSSCLIDLKDKKDVLLFSANALLLLVCLLLLLIIMCMACKRCRRSRKDKMVMMKSSSGVNGKPSECEVKYSSVNVEIETTPDEAQEQTPEEEVGGEASQVSAKENQNTAKDTNETSETNEATPTQEVDRSDQTDLKMEDLDKAE
ncbi:uncharacterized protein LOC113650266 [Tachysurus fulvidraco]|uniref:uncharacterized protein LOC113650266 n=1 Tax=Tachysurus fulvidraco TaxID=1234273 RepID=UPI001FED4592|nr:uncharacterized protein LOC113650266 [Tachysurus fulvidraco]